VCGAFAWARRASHSQKLRGFLARAAGRQLSPLDALYFSLETMATIGYSAPTDIFFDECPEMLVLLFMQTVLSLMMDAVLLGAEGSGRIGSHCIMLAPSSSVKGRITRQVLLGVVFNRVARGTNRARTILFSDRAVPPFTEDAGANVYRLTILT
jgi:hypothetical protein